MFSKKKRLNYLNMRENALKMKPEQMKMNIEKENAVYSVIADCIVDNDVVTLRCNLNGSVSRYRPNQKNDVGLGQKYTDISESSVELCTCCSDNLNSFQLMKKNDMFLMDPLKDRNVHVYMLTKKGVYGHIYDLSQDNSEEKPIKNIMNMINNIMKLIDEK